MNQIINCHDRQHTHFTESMTPVGGSFQQDMIWFNYAQKRSLTGTAIVGYECTACTRAVAQAACDSGQLSGIWMISSGGIDTMSKDESGFLTLSS